MPEEQLVWYKFTIDRKLEGNISLDIQADIFYVPTTYLFEFMRRFPEAKKGNIIDIKEEEFI